MHTGCSTVSNMCLVARVRDANWEADGRGLAFIGFPSHARAIPRTPLIVAREFAHNPLTSAGPTRPGMCRRHRRCVPMSATIHAFAGLILFSFFSSEFSCHAVKCFSFHSPVQVSYRGCCHWEIGLGCTCISPTHIFLARAGRRRIDERRGTTRARTVTSSRFTSRFGIRQVTRLPYLAKGL